MLNLTLSNTQPNMNANEGTLTIERENNLRGTFQYGRSRNGKGTGQSLSAPSLPSFSKTVPSALEYFKLS